MKPTDEPIAPIARRRFLQLLGSSVAVPSLAACTRQPREKIVPYVKAPEELALGRPLFYATHTLREGLGTGVLVETHAGRPTKVEGNPEHPASQGGTDAIQQAEILELYDPDRSQTLMHAGVISSWASLVGAVQVEMLRLRSRRGAGLRILTGATSSPSFLGLLDALLEEMPEARWHVHEPAASSSGRDGTRQAFGEPLDARYQLADADVLLTLDADLLSTTEGNPRYVRDFAERRKRGVASGEMSRVYAVECTPGLVGAMADERVAVRASEVELVARQLAAQLLGEPSIAAGALLDEGLLAALVKDLQDAGERALVVPGKYQPAIVHRLAHAMNATLGAKTVDYIEPVLARSAAAEGLVELVEALDRDEVELLLVLESNVAYSAPGELDMRARLGKAKLRVHLGRLFDETAALCHWHVPAAHAFEAWGDIKSYDGTTGFVQPLIEPLYAGKSALEMLASLGASPDRTGYQLLRDHWMGVHARGDFEHMWRRSLHDGVLAGSRARAKQDVALLEAPWPAVPARTEGLELVLRPHPSVHDGRYANNGWLQELPDPLTKLTWDNAACIAPRTAAELGVVSEDVVELTLEGRSLRAPVWVMPGQPAGAVTLHLGYGRTRGGKVLAGAGFDAYPLASRERWHAPGLAARKTGDSHPLASAQEHHSMEGRDLVRHASIQEYLEDASVLLEHAHGPKQRLSLYNRTEPARYSWGMSIDLTACVGCSACVVACQAENNIAVVGKEQVMRGREMHWLRIDRYYAGAIEAPRTHFQPVPCMQCENAPCEVVCPVHATAHHEEGLNDMVYNRCVGTRYCSNNCAYKVRRFNYHGYAVEPIGPLDPSAQSMRLAYNPDVTVRWVGVMEKCTYCVQRINHARIEAKKESRSIRDGEIMTACQAACPARAIEFGNLHDKNSAVSRKKAEPRNYTILAELNTEPHTSYLARLDNPHPALARPEEDGH